MRLRCESCGKFGLHFERGDGFALCEVCKEDYHCSHCGCFVDIDFFDLDHVACRDCAADIPSIGEQTEEEFLSAYGYGPDFGPDTESGYVFSCFLCGTHVDIGNSLNEEGSEVYCPECIRSNSLYPDDDTDEVSSCPECGSDRGSCDCADMDLDF